MLVSPNILTIWITLKHITDKMTLIDTLEYFLTETAADMESLSLEIREETNFEDNNVEGLSEIYDFNKELYDNLQQIKSIIERPWRRW
jgi:hypothetical protein